MEGNFFIIIWYNEDENLDVTKMYVHFPQFYDAD